MKRTYILPLLLAVLLTLAGCSPSSGNNSEVPYAGAPKIVIDRINYFVESANIIQELPEGYDYAGVLTGDELKYANIDGNKYYTKEGQDSLTDFYVYQECGTQISEDEVDNTQRQWAYIKWSKE